MSAEPTILHSREKLGWTFLLVSFSVFVAIIATTFLLITYSLQNLRRPLSVVLSANQGTVRVDEGNGVVRAIPVSDPPLEIRNGDTIYTDAPVSASLSLANSEDTSNEIARLQLYSNTTLHLESATTPRFDGSERPQSLDIQLENGRLRLWIAEIEGERPLIATITTPQGIIMMDKPGHYSLLVSESETQIAVLAGNANVTSVDKNIHLTTNQRAKILQNEAPIGPLIPQANLITNGDFSLSWESPNNPWELSDWNVERSGQPPGTVKFISSNKLSYAQITRFGQGHADINLVQPIGQTLNNLDFSPLWLQATFSILEHDLAVCGFQGSECPIFIQIEYVGVDGNVGIWQQGFYTNGEASDTTPYACFSCGGVQSAHDRVTQRETFTYDVDLKSELERQGAGLPQTINRISIISSGHSFAIQLMDIRLYTMALQESERLEPISNEQ